MPTAIEMNDVYLKIHSKGKYPKIILYVQLTFCKGLKPVVEDSYNDFKQERLVLELLLSDLPSGFV
jgi:hypothetical protein